jgi:hypothetical protein
MEAYHHNPEENTGPVIDMDENPDGTHTPNPESVEAANNNIHLEDEESTALQVANNNPHYEQIDPEGSDNMRIVQEIWNKTPDKVKTSIAKTGIEGVQNHLINPWAIKKRTEIMSNPKKAQIVRAVEALSREDQMELASWTNRVKAGLIGASFPLTVLEKLRFALKSEKNAKIPDYPVNELLLLMGTGVIQVHEDAAKEVEGKAMKVLTALIKYGPYAALVFGPVGAAAGAELSTLGKKVGKPLAAGAALMPLIRRNVQEAIQTEEVRVAAEAAENDPMVHAAKTEQEAMYTASVPPGNGSGENIPPNHTSADPSEVDGANNNKFEELRKKA